jgi:hypothetical protein
MLIPMDYLLIGSYLAALGVYLWARPAWRQIGPALLDSFVLGLLLFASGSVAVWFEGLADSGAVMRIGVAAGLSGTLGSTLWICLFRSRISGFDFFQTADRLHADPGDTFAITLGLTFSTLISLAFLIAVFSHEHIGMLLREAVVDGKGTLNEARIIISAGTEGYFAPGYVKQFRDVIVPILCVAAVLCHGTYPYRWLFYGALTVALASVFISGQRLVIVQFILCFGCVFAMDFFSSRRQRFIPLKIAVPMLIAMIVLVGAMTEMLGRLDMALSPKVQTAENEKAALRESKAVELASKLEANSSRLRIAEERLGASASAIPQAENGATEPKPVQKEIRNLEIEQEELQRALTKIRETDEPPDRVSHTLVSSGVPRPVAAVIALAHRAIIAVPRENEITYSLWAGQSPAMGAGWTTDLSGLRPGTQSQLSNRLSAAGYGGPLGDSPLGLAADIYYNWGWPGLAVVPLLYAFGFLWLDIFLVRRNSPLLYAAKLFMFFSIPLMYSPFMFLLYGGAVVVAMACYVALLRRGAFAFVGLRA